MGRVERLTSRNEGDVQVMSGSTVPIKAGVLEDLATYVSTSKKPFKTKNSAIVTIGGVVISQPVSDVAASWRICNYFGSHLNSLSTLQPLPN